MRSVSKFHFEGFDHLTESAGVREQKQEHRHQHGAQKPADRRASSSIDPAFHQPLKEKMNILETMLHTVVVLERDEGPPLLGSKGSSTCVVTHLLGCLVRWRDVVEKLERKFIIFKSVETH